MSNARDIMVRGLDRAAERYSDSIATRGLITAIPWVGGPIDAVFTTLASRAQAERIQALLTSISKEVDRLSEASVSKADFESEEWVDTVVAAFNASAQTRDREQIRLYAKLLVGSAIEHEAELPEMSTLIAVLAELSPLELALARVIADMPGSIRYDAQQQARREVTDSSWQFVIDNMPVAAKPNFLFHMKRLERVGLVSELTGGFGGTVGRFEPTPTLWRIVHFLREEKGTADVRPDSIRSQL